jgi:hypothetical protein
MDDKTSSAIANHSSAHRSEDAIDRGAREIAETRAAEERAQVKRRAEQQRQQQLAAKKTQEA